MIKRLYSTLKHIREPTEHAINVIKGHLLNAKWCISDDIISTYHAKQLYVTLQSLLHKPERAYMNDLNVNNDNRNDWNYLFRNGTSIPFGYSLIYGNPLSNESELGADGYDNYHAPVLGTTEFFKRRMWVGGSFQFNKGNPLRFGDKLNFTETVERLKVLNNSNLIFADYKREFNNDEGNSIIEKRSLCYLNNVFDGIKRKIIKNTTIPDESITIVPTIVSNFRMSALTFNSHQIHYNPNYASKTEKYPDVVVEAPLLVSLAFQFWINKNPNSNIKSFKYKITSPSFINHPITINYKTHEDNVRLWMTNNDSNVCFDSTIQI